MSRDLVEKAYDFWHYEMDPAEFDTILTSDERSEFAQWLAPELSAWKALAVKLGRVIEVYQGTVNDPNTKLDMRWLESIAVQRGSLTDGEWATLQDAILEDDDADPDRT